MKVGSRSEEKNLQFLLFGVNETSWDLNTNLESAGLSDLCIWTRSNDPLDILITNLA